MTTTTTGQGISIEPLSPSNIASPPPKALGTRPWINGNTLISSGNKDLDSILGGGLCLGTLTLVEEDRFSDHALLLAKYFVAQGVSGQQYCLVVGAEGSKAALEETFVTQLPFDLTYKRIQQAQQEQEQKNPALNPIPATSTRSPPPRSALSTFPLGLQQALPTPPLPTTKIEDPLSIAWQYRKYINTSPGKGRSSPSSSSSSSSNSSTFCHSYDLSRAMQTEVLAAAAAPPLLIDLADIADDAKQLQQGNGRNSHTIPNSFSHVYDAVASALQSLPPRTVLRVLLKSFLAKTSAWPTSSPGQALLLLHSLQQLARGQPMVILVTLPSCHLSRRQRRLFSRVADTVLELSSFAAGGREEGREGRPGEFEAFAGLLYVKGLQHINALAPVRGTSNKWGVRRDRRKLYIEPLHLPPEGVRTLTGDVEKEKKEGRKRERGNVPGMMCATGGRGGGGGSSLDF